MLDDADRLILASLRLDGRTSFARLAQETRLSPPAVAERVRKLERSGVITGYQAVIEPASVGPPFCAYVEITQQPRSSGVALAEALGRRPEIEEMHAVAGPYAYLAKVRVADPPALDAFLDLLMLIEGVERTQTVVVLRTIHDRPTALPFQHEPAGPSSTEPPV